MTIFFRLLEPDDKGAALHQAITQLTAGTSNLNTLTVEPASFQQVPRATFAYWVSERIRQVFTELPLFENEER